MLTVPVAETFDVDEQQIPVRRRPIGDDEDFREPSRLGTRRFDQGFTGVVSVGGRAEVELRRPDGTAGRLWFDDAYTCLQVYTVDEVTPGQSGVAFEPMTCAPDAFNSGDGLLVLEPGASWSASWGVTPL